MAGDTGQGSTGRGAAYTGDVTVGGPADVRELPGLVISKLAVSEMANNAYLLRDPQSGEALLIDADVEPRLFGVLPDETWVYPGHGKDTTLGAERPHLGEWRERGW